MECPYCGAELEYVDWYFRGNYSSGDYEKLGDIYKCPNFECFEDLEEAKRYVDVRDLIKGRDFSSLEEISCDSYNFGGHFYTDMSDNLFEGYPC